MKLEDRRIVQNSQPSSNFGVIAPAGVRNPQKCGVLLSHDAWHKMQTKPCGPAKHRIGRSVRIAPACGDDVGKISAGCLVYTVVACAAQLCNTVGLSIQRSLMFGTLYCTMLFYVANSIFPREVWHRALSLRYACIRSSGIILTPRLLCAKFRFCRGLHCWASLWRKNRILNHSAAYSIYQPSLFDVPGTEAFASK